jgi:YD repeat-containing protein
MTAVLNGPASKLDHLHVEHIANRHDVTNSRTGEPVGTIARQGNVMWQAYAADGYRVGDPDGYLCPEFAITPLALHYRAGLEH